MVAHPCGDERPRGDGAVFPRTVRRATTLSVTIVAGIALAPSLVGGGRDLEAHIAGLSAATLLFSIPALLACVVAVGRLPAGRRGTWVAWGLAHLLTALATGVLWAAVAGGRTPGVGTALASVAIGGVGLVVGNVWALSRVSAARSSIADVLTGLLTTGAVVVPVLLLVGHDLVGADELWLAVGGAAWAVLAVHAVVTLAQVRHRLARGDRTPITRGLVVGCLATVDASGHAWLAIVGHDVPVWPFTLLRAATAAGLLMVFLAGVRGPMRGLERLPVADQVRRDRAADLLVALGASATLALVLVGPARVDTRLAVVALGVGCVLSTWRHAVVAGETQRSARQLAAAADERRRLLEQVASLADRDLSRVAEQLHRQAVILRTGLTPLLAAVERDGGTSSALLARVARTRGELDAQGERFRAIARSLAPEEDAPDMATRLETILLAHGTVSGDLRDGWTASVTAPEGLFLDPVREAVLLRVLRTIVDDPAVAPSHAGGALQLELSVVGAEVHLSLPAQYAQVAAATRREVGRIVDAAAGELVVGEAGTELRLPSPLAVTSPARPPDLQVVAD